MIVLGLDPGLATLGVGAVSLEETPAATPRCLGYAHFVTEADVAIELRLYRLAAWFAHQLAQYRPDVVSVEEVFLGRNAGTAMLMCHARGACLLKAAEAGMPVVTYAPMVIKQAVSGYGKASKDQVQSMIQRLLALDVPVTPDHCADALAVALCHAHRSRGGAANPAMLDRPAADRRARGGRFKSLPAHLLDRVRRS